MSETLQLRVRGAGPGPTLIYLPGLHGDWTLVGGFRAALGDRARFVEMTYPRTLDWTLEEYAAAIEEGLREHGIREGWLIAESFGSQVAWPLLGRKRFPAQGLILAGGFVRYPIRRLVRFAEMICGGVSLSLTARILFGYAAIARYRFRRSPETLANLEEFIARRTELDRQAAVHRLRLIMRSDPRAIARETTVPVYALSGLVDPVVPWIFVRPWLRRHCPALRGYRIIWRADHTVLATAPDAAADLVAMWMAGDS